MTVSETVCSTSTSVDTFIEKQILMRFLPFFAYISVDIGEKGKKPGGHERPELSYFNRAQSENLSLGKFLFAGTTPIYPQGGPTSAYNSMFPMNY